MASVQDFTHVANDMIAQMRTSLANIEMPEIDMSSIDGMNILTMVVFPIILVVLAGILIFDLIQLYEIMQLQAAAAAGRAYGNDPMLMSQLLLNYYSSPGDWQQILNGLQLAAEKYGGNIQNGIQLVADKLGGDYYL